MSMTRFQNTQLQNGVFQIIIELFYWLAQSWKRALSFINTNTWESTFFCTVIQHDRAEFSDSMLPGDVGDNRAAIESIKSRDFVFFRFKFSHSQLLFDPGKGGRFITELISVFILCLCYVVHIASQKSVCVWVCVCMQRVCLDLGKSGFPVCGNTVEPGFVIIVSRPGTFLQQASRRTWWHVWPRTNNAGNGEAKPRQALWINAQMSFFPSSHCPQILIVWGFKQDFGPCENSYTEYFNTHFTNKVRTSVNSQCNGDILVCKGHFNLGLKSLMW